MKSVRLIGFLIGCVVLIGWAVTLWHLKHASLIYIISAFNFFISITWLYGVCTTSYKNRCRFLFLSLFWICLNLALLAIFTFTLLLSNELDQLLQEHFYITVVIGTCVIVLVISCTICNYLNEDDDEPPVSEMRSQHQPRLAVKKRTQKRKNQDIDCCFSGSYDDGGGNNDENYMLDGSDQRGSDSHGNYRSSHTTHLQHNYDSLLAPSHHGMHHTGTNSHQNQGTHHANNWKSTPSHQYHSNDTHYTPSHSTHHDTHTFSHDTHTFSHDTSTADTGGGD